MTLLITEKQISELVKALQEAETKIDPEATELIRSKMTHIELIIRSKMTHAALGADEVMVAKALLSLEGIGNEITDPKLLVPYIPEWLVSGVIKQIEDRDIEVGYGLPDLLDYARESVLSNLQDTHDAFAVKTWTTSLTEDMVESKLRTIARGAIANVMRITSTQDLSDFLSTD